MENATLDYEITSWTGRQNMLESLLDELKEKKHLVACNELIELCKQKLRLLESMQELKSELD